MRGRSRTKLAKFSSLVFVVAAAALMVAPTGAGAATTLGDTFDPTTACDPDVTRLQSASGGQYTAPTNGVITRWEYQADADEPNNMRFKVGRATGTTNEFFI